MSYNQRPPLPIQNNSNFGNLRKKIQQNIGPNNTQSGLNLGLNLTPIRTSKPSE